MNRRNLTAAVLAGLAGAAGIASTAQAVNLNYDGLGDVLIYPYYTTNGDNLTILSVVNTTGAGKAVKVRFLESQNSQEVLDFNLYLSPYDVWAAAVVKQDDDDGRTDVTGIVVTDTSCTVPTIEGQADSFQGFFEFQYEKDGGTDALYRANEGYVEMIEMATIEEGSPVDLATNHVTDSAEAGYGYPGDCNAHLALWDPAVTDPDYEALEGIWIETPDFGLDEPSGGLFGGGAILNPADGSMFSYDARALEDFATEVDHTNPGSTSPSLGTGVGVARTAQVYNSATQMVETFTYDNSADAVSALFMHDTMMNEYNIESAAGANTEWVVNFPTKRFYVNGVVVRAPFTSLWSDNWDEDDFDIDGDGDIDSIKDGACEIVNLGPGLEGLWNREEETWDPDEYECDPFGDPVFSPQPPVEGEVCYPVDTVSLCHEVSILRFGDGVEDYAGPTEIFGAMQPRVANIDVDALISGAEAGWMQVNLSDATDPNVVDDDLVPVPKTRYLTDEEGKTLAGLPMTGFMAYRAMNNFAETNQDGVLATQHYGGLFSHKATRMISYADD